jgi:hypothetical protein
MTWRVRPFPEATIPAPEEARSVEHDFHPRIFGSVCSSPISSKSDWSNTPIHFKILSYVVIPPRYIQCMHGRLQGNCQIWLWRIRIAASQLGLHQVQPTDLRVPSLEVTAVRCVHAEHERSQEGNHQLLWLCQEKGWGQTEVQFQQSLFNLLTNGNCHLGWAVAHP